MLHKLGKMWPCWLIRMVNLPRQPTPKEFLVFAERIFNQLKQLKEIPFGAKFGGATGNFNAHYVAYPSIDWIAFANNFVNKK